MSFVVLSKVLKMSVHKLFEQIVKSEQSAEIRDENIVKIKRQIAETESELKSLKDSCVSSRGRLRIFVRQYHEENSECQVSVQQKRVLQERKSEILDEIEDLRKIQEKKTEKLEELKADFSNSVMTFCSQYDLTGIGAEKRKQEKQKELEGLKKEVEVEQKKLEALQHEEEIATEMMEQKACYNAEISQLQSQIIEVDSLLEKKRQETIDMTEKVNKFQADLFKNSELVRLRRELDSIKNQDLEGKIRNLKAELDRVKREKWQGGPQQNRSSSGGRYKFHSVNR